MMAFLDKPFLNLTWKKETDFLDEILSCDGKKLDFISDIIQTGSCGNSQTRMP